MSRAWLSRAGSKEGGRVLKQRVCRTENWIIVGVGSSYQLGAVDKEFLPLVRGRRLPTAVIPYRVQCCSLSRFYSGSETLGKAMSC